MFFVCHLFPLVSTLDLVGQPTIETNAKFLIVMYTHLIDASDHISCRRIRSTFNLPVKIIRKAMPPTLSQTNWRNELYAHLRRRYFAMTFSLAENHIQLLKIFSIK